jgi:hypothetical protein
MGCDQILGARIVNAEGEIVEADQEMLWGLRGVVVSLDVRCIDWRGCWLGWLPFLLRRRGRFEGGIGR